MKVFVNYLENYGRTANTDLTYPKNLTRLNGFCDINVETNSSAIQPAALKLFARLKRTRLAKYLKWTPHDEVILWAKSLSKYDVLYSSYIYPKLAGGGTAPPSVLRINYQTDAVLASRREGDIRAARERIARRWRRFDAVITTTRFSLPRIEEESLALHGRVYYCPFFLPDAHEITADEFETKSNASVIDILFVGRDGTRKGLLEFVDAVSSLAEDLLKQIRLTVVSETKCDKGKLGRTKVRYVTRASNPEVLALMKRSHIFCLPTKSEAYGIVFVEAMSQGCAILSDNDLPRLEIVRDNGAGICVDPNRPRELKRALEKLILDQVFRERCMVNALNSYKREFAPDVVATRHWQIFQEVVRRAQRERHG